MSICPFAVQQIIPESHTQGAIRPTTLIFHEAVSNADSLYNYWNSPGNELESHFYIGRDGTLYQFVDTQVRADANMSANSFAISVETWDNGGDVNAPWNAAQLATAKRLAAWCRDEHDIPGRAPATWSSGGVGGHNWFPDEWAGGPRACPGPNRSAQIRNAIIPHVAGGGGWQDGDDIVTPQEMEAVANLTVEKLKTSLVYFSWRDPNNPAGRIDDSVQFWAMWAQLYPTMFHGGGFNTAWGPGVLPRLMAIEEAVAKVAEANGLNREQFLADIREAARAGAAEGESQDNAEEAAAVVRELATRLAINPITGTPMDVPAEVTA